MVVHDSPLKARGVGIGAVRPRAVPDRTSEVDPSAFEDGHRKGYSVTGEILANMAEAKRITFSASELSLNWGRAPAEHRPEGCRRIREVHQRDE